MGMGMEMLEVSNTAIAASFGRAVRTYDDFALVQAHCAQQLVSFWAANIAEAGGALPLGPRLEVGCGTGFLSQALWQQDAQKTRPKTSQHGSDRAPLLCTDLAPAMVAACQERLAQDPLAQDPLAPAGVQFGLLDGTQLRPELTPERYSAIASNFVVQWFPDPLATLGHWLQCLRPRGWLAIAFPTCHSFRQWQQHCDALNLPYPARTLPDPTPIISQLHAQAHRCLFYQDFLPLQAPDAQSFLRHFHRIGAVPPGSALPKLSTAQLRQLIRHWNHHSPNGIEVDYHVTYLLVQR